MKHKACRLEVKEFPETLTETQRQLFLGEVQSYLIDDRPQIVLDFSKVGQMNRLAVQLLLSCLEEAIKRNGDVKLAAVSAEARSALRLTGADRLFEIFDTSAEAVGSFRRTSVDEISHSSVSGAPHWAAGNVA